LGPLPKRAARSISVKFPTAMTLLDRPGRGLK